MAYGVRPKKFSPSVGYASTDSTSSTSSSIQTTTARKLQRGCNGFVDNAEGAPKRCPYLHFCGADDGIRTRDPNLGKVVLYQLSYVRVRGRR